MAMGTFIAPHTPAVLAALSGPTSAALLPWASDCVIRHPHSAVMRSWRHRQAAAWSHGVRTGCSLPASAQLQGWLDEVLCPWVHQPVHGPIILSLGHGCFHAVVRLCRPQLSHTMCNPHMLPALLVHPVDWLLHLQWQGKHCWHDGKGAEPQSASCQGDAVRWVQLCMAACAYRQHAPATQQSLFSMNSAFTPRSSSK